MDKYKKIIDITKRLIKEENLKSKKTKSIDITSCCLEIESLKHELHCLCVEIWVACLEEHRYWEKHRYLDSFHELLVNFRRPDIF